MKPFFSIVIPTLNEEEYLPRLLNSLVKQKSHNFEVIIIDGNSQDKTSLIALSYQHHIPINFKSLKKGNLSLQKNRGASLAKSDLLIFFDADMLIGRNFTKMAEKELKKRKGFVFIPYLYPIEKKEYPELHAIMFFLNRLVGLSLETKKPFSAGPAQIWDRDVFLKIKGFDDIFGEDHQIIRKAKEWGIHIRQISTLKVWYSLRRFKREGRLKLFTHFIRCNIHMLFNDKLGKEFEYSMGGHLYRKKNKESNTLAKINPEQLLKNFNKNIKSFIRRLDI